MDKKRKEDLEFRARKHAQNGEYKKPHSGAFGLRNTVFGREHTENQKEERRHYDRVWRDEKGK